jgi:hypothetical protein
MQSHGMLQNIERTFILLKSKAVPILPTTMLAVGHLKTDKTLLQPPN